MDTEYLWEISVHFLAIREKLIFYYFSKVDRKWVEEPELGRCYFGGFLFKPISKEEVEQYREWSNAE